jgi:hypothetical protein
MDYIYLDKDNHNLDFAKDRRINVDKFIEAWTSEKCKPFQSALNFVTQYGNLEIKLKTVNIISTLVTTPLYCRMTKYGIDTYSKILDKRVLCVGLIIGLNVFLLVSEDDKYYVAINKEISCWGDSFEDFLETVFTKKTKYWLWSNLNGDIIHLDKNNISLNFAKGRHINIDKFIEARTSEKCKPFQSALDFVKQYGDLEINLKTITKTIVLVTRAEYCNKSKESLYMYSKFLGKKVLCVGCISESILDLIISEDGKFYLVGDEDYDTHCGNSFEELLKNIINQKSICIEWGEIEDFYD